MTPEFYSDFEDGFNPVPSQPEIAENKRASKSDTKSPRLLGCYFVSVPELGSMDDSQFNGVHWQHVPVQFTALWNAYILVGGFKHFLFSISYMG